MKESRKVLLVVLFAIIISEGCIGQNGTATGVERQLYNLSPEAFAELPEFPADFNTIDNQVATLSYDTLGLKDIGEKYYKQPEFYPTWESVGVKNMQNPPDGRIGIWGFGAYPSEQSLTTKAGDESTATTFFHTSWMVQTMQGIELVPEYDHDIFDAKIEPKIFLLGKAYPIFEKNWVQRVILKIKAAKDAKHGIYEISLRTKAPPEQYQKQWREEYESYVNAPMAGPDRPFLILKVEVKS